MDIHNITDKSQLTLTELSIPWWPPCLFCLFLCNQTPLSPPPSRGPPQFSCLGGAVRGLTGWGWRSLAPLPLLIPHSHPDHSPLQDFRSVLASPQVWILLPLSSSEWNRLSPHQLIHNLFMQKLLLVDINSPKGMLLHTFYPLKHLERVIKDT